MKKIKIAATGLSGLVGSRIQELLFNDFIFIDIPQDKVDITDYKSTKAFFSPLSFDYFLHLAAFTNVDSAENNKQFAWNVNVDGTKHVFDQSIKKGAKFLYISTDFVFDGTNPPFTETSTPNPISYYGLTKWEGEKIVKDKAMIIRISYPYRCYYELKKDIIASIINTLQNHQAIYGITDAYFTLTFIDDIAYALKQLIINYVNDTFHIVGSDSHTGYEIIQSVSEVFNLDKSLIKKTTFSKFYKGKAKRPKKSIITSVNNTFYTMKTLKEGLLEIQNQINN